MSEPPAAVRSFGEWLETQARRFNQAIARLGSELPNAPPHGAGPAAAYALNGEGKRIRAALCLAAFRSVRPDADDEAVVELACAIEVIHTYSLMHDDLPCMDNDSLRRGRPTPHVVHGTPAAMTAGVALIPFAFHVLLRSSARLGLTADVRRALAIELARAAGAAGMVGGQVLDLEAEGRATALDDLEFLHLAKTGALIAACARIGALAAGATGDALLAFRLYGRRVGLAFQIIDDVLDVTANPESLGKHTGKDKTVAKATFPAFMGIDGARVRADFEVQRALSALDTVGLRTPELEGLARFAIERER